MVNDNNFIYMYICKYQMQYIVAHQHTIDDGLRTGNSDLDLVFASRLDFQGRTAVHCNLWKQTPWRILNDMSFLDTCNAFHVLLLFLYTVRHFTFWLNLGPGTLRNDKSVLETPGTFHHFCWSFLFSNFVVMFVGQSRGNSKRACSWRIRGFRTLPGCCARSRKLMRRHGTGGMALVAGPETWIVQRIRRHRSCIRTQRHGCWDMDPDDPEPRIL